MRARLSAGTEVSGSTPPGGFKRLRSGNLGPDVEPNFSSGGSECRAIEPVCRKFRLHIQKAGARYPQRMRTRFPRAATAVAALALAGALARAQSTGQTTPRPGNPEDHLPPNITHLTWFGERGSWSPDGQRLAFMSKSFGDAFEIDLRTRAIRLLTHYPHPGFLRVQYLPNGDYFLIGARSFADVNATR